MLKVSPKIQKPKESTFSLIFKAGLIILIIVGFSYIIMQIMKAIAKAKPCDSETPWNDAQKKCMEKCPTGKNYDKNLKCITTCDIGKSYNYTSQKCVACPDTETGNEASNEYGAEIRHSCPNGNNNCGTDCDIMQFRDVTDSTKPGTKKIGGQEYSCDEAKCVCKDENYERCFLDRSDNTSLVCYDKSVAMCNCDTNTGICKVETCDQSIRLSCKKDCCDPPTGANKTGPFVKGVSGPEHDCCNGSCCKKVDGVSNCKTSTNGDSFCCSGENDVFIESNKEGMCCVKKNVYCKSGSAVSWTTNGPKCGAAGDELACCPYNLCVQDVLQDDGVTRITTSKCCAEDNCGNPSLCSLDTNTFTKFSPSSPIYKKCIGMIGTKCAADDPNCMSLCVNKSNDLHSSFNSPKDGKCPSLDDGSIESPKDVKFSHDPCLDSSDCIGYSNINKCVTFANNEWVTDSSGKLVETTCDKTKNNQASMGGCLSMCTGVGCGKSKIYCGEGHACVCDKGGGYDYCIDSNLPDTEDSVWPNSEDGKVLWGQTYVAKGDHCMVGNISCVPGDTCPGYFGMNNIDKKIMDCVPQSDGTGLCMAQAETDINGDTFCRVNYDSTEKNSLGDTLPMNTMSLLGSKDAKASYASDCTAKNFAGNSTNPPMITCGDPRSKTSISFPYYAGGSDGYQGPWGVNGAQQITPLPVSKGSYDCGRQAWCEGPGQNKSPYLGNLNDNAVDALKQQWSAYNVKEWKDKSSDEPSTKNICINRAVYGQTGQISQLSRISWEGSTGTCKAEYDHKPGEDQNIDCASSDCEECCVNKLKLSDDNTDTVNSGLICKGASNQAGLVGLSSSDHSDSSSLGIFGCGDQWHN